MPAEGHAADARRAPVECGDLPFLIRRDGTWLYRGTPIKRKELVCLFASVLRREEDGELVAGDPGRARAHRGRGRAVRRRRAGLDTATGRQQMLSFRTNVDQVVTAGPEHPIRVAHDILTCEPTPYLLCVRAPARTGVEARINRAVYYELVALAVPEWVGCRRMLGVWSCGQFFPLGELPPGEE